MLEKYFLWGSGVVVATVDTYAMICELTIVPAWVVAMLPFIPGKARIYDLVLILS